MAGITQQELAQMLGVSRSTVAAALNPASKVRLSDETRRKIQETAAKYDYCPDHFAMVMRQGRSRSIGILHFGGLLQVAAERALHAGEAVRRRGYTVVSADVSWSVDSLPAACQSFLNARVEGVVVAGLNAPNAEAGLELLRKANLPVVTLSGNPLSWAPHFRGDARQATYELTTHLLECGHRKLAILCRVAGMGDIGRSYAWGGQERLAGFEMALKAAGGEKKGTLESSDALEGIWMPGAFQSDPFNPFEPGYEGMKRILELPVRPTAVVCENDELAIGAMAACRAQGLRIPEEIAITGYDYTSVGQYADVPLTTIRQPNETMAEKAVETLFKLIDGGTVAETEALQIFPCEMIVRASSSLKLRC